MWKEWLHGGDISRHTSSERGPPLLHCWWRGCRWVQSRGPHKCSAPSSSSPVPAGWSPPAPHQHPSLHLSQSRGCWKNGERSFLWNIRRHSVTIPCACVCVEQLLRVESTFKPCFILLLLALCSSNKKWFSFPVFLLFLFFSFIDLLPHPQVGNHCAKSNYKSPRRWSVEQGWKQLTTTTLWCTGETTYCI